MPDYPVSVVVPTRAGWPAMRLSIDAVLPQVRGIGGQLIVADASGLAPPGWSTEPGILWLEMPGRPGPELRQAGYAAAEAPVIAITEDHAAPTADWLATLIAEHAAHPDAAAIYGIVENGSRDHLLDWALYGVGYLPWGPPRPDSSGSPGHANLSFKSWAFDRLAPTGDTVLEFLYVNALRRAGHSVIASDQLRVVHYQSAGWRKTSKLFFHNGRAIAGLRRERMTSRDWIRAAAPGLIAGYRTLRTLAVSRRKPDLTSVIARSLPVIAYLHALHAFGESVGYLDGPGDSATHLH